MPPRLGGRASARDSQGEEQAGLVRGGLSPSDSPVRDSTDPSSDERVN